MTSKSRIGKIAFAAALVAASGGAALGLTSIASASLGSSAPAVDGNPTELMPQAAPSDDNGTTSMREGMRRGPVTENLAKVLDLTVDELHAELASGKTIAQIAEAQKVDIDDVTKVMISDFKAHLDEEVASGEHTQAEADAKLAKFTENVDTIVTTAIGRGHGGKDGHGRHGRGTRFITESLAKVLSMTVEELRTELRSGKTIAQIAEAQKVDIDDVKAALKADIKAHLDEEVASGEHTRAEADAKLKEFESRLDDIVNNVRPPKGDHSDAPPADGASSSGASVPA